MSTRNNRKGAYADYVPGMIYMSAFEAAKCNSLQNEPPSSSKTAMPTYRMPRWAENLAESMEKVSDETASETVSAVVAEEPTVEALEAPEQVADGALGLESTEPGVEDAVESNGTKRKRRGLGKFHRRTKKRRCNVKLLANVRKLMNFITWQKPKTTVTSTLAPPYMVLEKITESPNVNGFDIDELCTREIKQRGLSAQTFDVHRFLKVKKKRQGKRHVRILKTLNRELKMDFRGQCARRRFRDKQTTGSSECEAKVFRQRMRRNKLHRKSCKTDMVETT